MNSLPIYLSEKFDFPSSSRGTSGVVFHKAVGEKIIGTLKDPSSVDRNRCVSCTS